MGGVGFYVFLKIFRKIYHHLTPLKITKSTQGAGKMILRHALRCPKNMVQLRGICLIHLPKSIFGYFSGKVKDSSFVSAGTVYVERERERG